ncbi:MAG: phosphoenolpyruvate synthase [Gammaproteobacteria bacterium]|nr:phosphoenolpyruvate synthase [Gammaproteobacteria bacterium]
MRYVRRFDELTINDVPLVGGKNASLGEMFRTLKPKGVNVPDGFATTAEAYWAVLDYNKLREPIFDLLAGLDVNDVVRLAEVGQTIRDWLTHANLPDELANEITEAYRRMSGPDGAMIDVAVRSSATAEDLPTASFAGQQETYLNIRGEASLLATCKRVYASLFTDRAIAYRVHQGFAHDKVALSIGVQRMVRSDLASSGVMFTLDTESGFRDAVLITAAWGLGENVVQGAVNPDEFLVFKPTLANGHRPIIKRQLGSKAMRMIYTHDSLAGRSTRNIEVPPDERHRFCISDDEVLELARQAVIIEQHYGRPMDIEWAKDGNTGELFIVQARPETVQTQADANLFKQYILNERGTVLAAGRSVGQKIATGQARVILHARDMHELQPGEVLVTDITDPDWEPIMKRASAIVTNRGGRTCHAAIVARELGIPAVVGCGDATQTVPDGEVVTVSCAEGDTGFVYQGALPFRVEEQRLDEAATHTRTKVYLNVAQPEQAFEFSRLPSDGVGLARLEFIIMRSIQAHPKALLHPDKVDEATRRKIAHLIRGHADGRDFFVKRLSEGVAQIAAAFYPRPVIVRFSDFKSNEYAALLGGSHFEPDEENPMIGLRGAARYHHPDYAEGFVLECAAMRRVREEMGLTNVALLLPFVRTVEEAREVIGLMEENGLVRGKAGLAIYIMCEIPANVILAESFLALCDGFSIGSNDLTQLTLGVDRDSGLLTGFDERDPAVLELIRMAIKACKKQGKYIGICGQAPSDFPEITRFLVEQGIDSLSLNPDSLLKMRQVVREAEGG